MFALKSVAEFEHVLNAGLKNRMVDTTKMGRTSAYAHSIFTIVVESSATDARGEKRVRVGARRRRSALGRQASRSEPPRSRSGFRRDPTNWHTAVAPRIVGDADGTLCRHRCTRPRLLTANALCTAPALTVQKAPASAASSTRRAIAAGHRGIMSSPGPHSGPLLLRARLSSRVVPFF